jgi:HK97 family phage major capsid protein
MVKEAIEFQIACAVNKSKKEYGLQIEDCDRINANPDVENYQKYQKVFNKFLRRTGGSKDAIMEPEESKTLSVGVDPDGGYTVTPQMASTIITTIRESDPIRQLAAVESISTDSIEWLVDVDQMGAGWETETAPGAATSTANFNKKQIWAHTMYAKVLATQKLLEDSSLNIENWIANKIGDRFGRLEGAAFVTGTGIGQPRGFLTYGDGTAWGTVEQVHMGHATALTADGFIDVKYHLVEAYIERANAWLMARSTLAAAMKLKDGSGEYIWKPSLIALDPSSSILGIPVKMSTTMPVIAANALSVALADWKSAYTIVDRLGITVQRDPYTSKPFVEFYTRKRVGGDITNFHAIKIGTIEA